MEFSEDDIDIFDRYLRNELTEKETESLRLRMKDPEFAAEMKSYLSSVNVVNEAGREELRNQFTNIQQEVESSGGYENYKPSIKGKGFGGGSWFISGFVALIAVVAYLIYSGKITREQIQNILPTTDKIDTVYHYNITRDTIIKNSSKTIKRDTVRYIKYDTVYTRQRIIKEVPTDSADVLMKQDTVYLNK
jgi:hypothetical protein